MRALLVAVIAALCAWPASAAAEGRAPKEMVLLTVSGLVGESNRGPLVANKDSLLATQKIDFPKAFACDRAMLLALPQGTVTATTKELGAPATFKGPLLREVLGRIEAAKTKISFVAVNGFTGWLLPEDVDGSDWVLALEVDGTPLGIGQQGPLWLINTRGRGAKAGRRRPRALGVGRVLYAGRRVTSRQRDFMGVI
jgi:hypothetical protein